MRISLLAVWLQKLRWIELTKLKIAAINTSSHFYTPCKQSSRKKLKFAVHVESIEWSNTVGNFVWSAASLNGHLRKVQQESHFKQNEIKAKNSWHKNNAIPFAAPTKAAIKTNTANSAERFDLYAECFISQPTKLQLQAVFFRPLTLMLIFHAWIFAWNGRH